MSTRRISPDATAADRGVYGDKISWRHEPGWPQRAASALPGARFSTARRRRIAHWVEPDAITSLDETAPRRDVVWELVICGGEPLLIRTMEDGRRRPEPWFTLAEAGLPDGVAARLREVVGPPDSRSPDSRSPGLAALAAALDARDLVLEMRSGSLSTRVLRAARRLKAQGPQALPQTPRADDAIEELAEALVGSAHLGVLSARRRTLRILRDALHAREVDRRAA